MNAQPVRCRFALGRAPLDLRPAAGQLVTLQELAAAGRHRAAPAIFGIIGRGPPGRSGRARTGRAHGLQGQSVRLAPVWSRPRAARCTRMDGMCEGFTALPHGRAGDGTGEQAFHRRKETRGRQGYAKIDRRGPIGARRQRWRFSERGSLETTNPLSPRPGLPDLFMPAVAAKIRRSFLEVPDQFIDELKV